MAGDKALPLSDASSLPASARGNAFLLFFSFHSSRQAPCACQPLPPGLLLLPALGLLWAGGPGSFPSSSFSSPFLKPALCTELWDLMQHKELLKLFSTSKTSSIFSSLLSGTGSGWILAGQVQLLLQAPLQPMVNSVLCWKCNELSIATAWCTPRPAPSCSAAPPGWHCLSPASLHVRVLSRSTAGL